MSGGELSPETEDVLRRVRQGEDRMPAPRRRRLKGALLARIAVGASATLAAGQGAASTLGVGFVAKTVVGLALLGSIGAGSYLALRPKRLPPARHAAPVVVAAPVVEAEPSPVVEPPHVRHRVPRPRPAPARHVVEAPPAPVDEAAALAAETALLREADRALRAGDTATALARLDEHATRFPNGALAPERAAERLIVLCELGVADARDLSQFLSSHAGSPLAARVRRACAPKP